jgi:hypothetical protein
MMFDSRNLYRLEDSFNFSAKLYGARLILQLIIGRIQNDARLCYVASDRRDVLPARDDDWNGWFNRSSFS